MLASRGGHHLGGTEHFFRVPVITECLLLRACEVIAQHHSDFQIKSCIIAISLLSASRQASGLTPPALLMTLMFLAAISVNAGGLITLGNEVGGITGRRLSFNPCTRP
jgi:hypothetical protein